MASRGTSVVPLAPSMTREEAHLRVLPHDAVEDGLVGGVGETAFFSGLFVIFVPRAQSLRAEVEGISEWFVDALQGVLLGHEDLDSRVIFCAHTAGSQRHRRDNLPFRRRSSKPVDG